MTAEILFLVGMPRSGTKLLRDILNRHPDVSLFPVESHFIPYFASQIPKYGDMLDRENFARFHADFRRTTFDNNMVARGMAVDREIWFENLNGSTYDYVFDALFQSYAQLTGCRIVGDKTPAYITEVPLLSQTFPGARFIHIVRDPRDYVLSNRNAWNQDLRRAAQLWKQSIRKFRKDIDDRKIDYCELRYEDLLTNAHSSVEYVCDYLGIGFREDMMVLDRPSENLGDAKGATHILQKNFDKWKTRLDNSEVKAVESISGALMSEFGYSVRFLKGDHNIGGLRMNILRAKDTWNRFRFILGEEKELRSALSRMNRVGRF